MALGRALMLALLLGVTPAWAGKGQPHSFPAQGQVEVAFSPDEDVEGLILRHLAAARATIRVQAYIFTSRPIADALVKARQRGVDVQVLADGQMNARGNKALQQLLDAGVPLAFETDYAAAHNKIILIDAARSDGAVLTGSYNFTWSAREKNAENLLVLSGHPPLLKLYADEWKAHAAKAVAVRRFPWKN